MLTQMHHLCRHVLDQPSVQDHLAGGGWWPRGRWGGVQLFGCSHAEGPPQIPPPGSGHAHHWLCSLWGTNLFRPFFSLMVYSYAWVLCQVTFCSCHLYISFFVFFSADSRRGKQSIYYYRLFCMYILHYCWMCWSHFSLKKTFFD